MTFTNNRTGVVKLKIGVTEIAEGLIYNDREESNNNNAKILLIKKTTLLKADNFFIG
jgi:hypothetical protein